MLVSKDLGILNCSRVPFTTGMGREALVVGVPIKTRHGPATAECLRLCTTHLESFWDRRGYRPSQLALIASMLKGKTPSPYKAAAGIAGGYINAIDKAEHEFHKHADIDLKDVWENTEAPPIPKLKRGQKDLTYVKARGNTFGYQPISSNRKPLGKFFYTGHLMSAVRLIELEKIGQVSWVYTGNCLFVDNKLH